MRESGTIDKIFSKGEVSGKLCRNGGGGSGQYYAISFTNIFSAFVALCFGIGKSQNLILIQLLFETGLIQSIPISSFDINIIISLFQASPF